MPTTTSNYALFKPLVNNATDQDLWGGYLNDDMDDIDTLLRAGITVATQSSQTSGFTADASISVKKLYPCDASSAGFTATLPAAATTANGATVYIKKTDSSANAVTIARTGSDTIDGATSLSLSGRNDCYCLVSDGVSKWNAAASLGAPTGSPAFTGTPTAPTAAVNTSTTQLATTAFANPGASLGNDGYHKLPSGLIMQWGRYTSSMSSEASVTISFPLAFPSACYMAQATILNSAASSSNNAGMQLVSRSLTQAVFYSQFYNTMGAFPEGFDWFALGS